MPTKPDITGHFARDLSVAKANAIDLLVSGATDQETAEAVGVTRQTVNGWSSPRIDEALLAHHDDEHADEVYSAAGEHAGGQVIVEQRHAEENAEQRRQQSNRRQARHRRPDRHPAARHHQGVDTGNGRRPRPGGRGAAHLHR